MRPSIFQIHLEDRFDLRSPRFELRARPTGSPALGGMRHILLHSLQGGVNRTARQTGHASTRCDFAAVELLAVILLSIL
jgi:hypothetical protein